MKSASTNRRNPKVLPPTMGPASTDLLPPAPPTTGRNSKLLISDPRHVHPVGGDPVWAHDACERVKLGYVHSVWCAPLTVCFWKRADGRLVMRANSRHSDFTVTMESPYPPSIPTMRFLYQEAAALVAKCDPAPPTRH